MNKPNTLLFNEYGRLRSGWRATLFLVSFTLIATALIVLSLSLLRQFSLGESIFSLLSLTIPFAISTLIALCLGWICGRFFEGLPFRAQGACLTRGWFAHLFGGCVVGAVTFLIAFIFAISSGGLSISLNRISSGGDIATSLLVTLIVFSVGAASEETLFRGYLLQTFTRAKLVWFGIAMTAILFAFAHNGNPEANRLSWLNTLVAGVWFGLAYLKTRDIWFPFGIHLMWNWLQGPIFGINVSGISGFASHPLFRPEDTGPEWLTGGAYGIEGGIACTIAIVLSILSLRFLPYLKPTEEMLRMTNEEKSSRTLGNLNLKRNIDRPS